ncbi:MAG: DUF1045 domain-containing protein [Sulfitobacter sp.]
MFERYAIFYCPTGELAQLGAAWLGWDSAEGASIAHPDCAPLDVAALTKRPRKYGLHGTLKAPFYLSDDSTLSDVQRTARTFAAQQAPVPIGALALRHENGFIGLRPEAPQDALRTFGADIVRRFDPHRAPLRDADITRRRKSRLSPQQDAQMLEWGYPFIFDDFHFHLTLTGRVTPDLARDTIAALSPILTPSVPDPFIIDAITIVGQDADGMFHQIQSYPLTG